LQISYLKRLEILDLSNNKIPRLDTVFPLTLSTLLLSNNGISELPVQLTALTALQSLQLTGMQIHTTQHNTTLVILSTIMYYHPYNLFAHKFAFHHLTHPRFLSHSSVIFIYLFIYF
jgi:Leucine-rich repeat (LRR) protein